MLLARRMMNWRLVVGGSVVIAKANYKWISDRRSRSRRELNCRKTCEQHL
jgi:hypothetical protein